MSQKPGLHDFVLNLRCLSACYSLRGVAACSASDVRRELLGAQVPLLTVMEAVAPVRVPGRLPLYQVWFDIQPVSFEGAEKLEDLDIQPLTQARRCLCGTHPAP